MKYSGNTIISNTIALRISKIITDSRIMLHHSNRLYNLFRVLEDQFDVLISQDTHRDTLRLGNYIHVYIKKTKQIINLEIN